MHRVELKECGRRIQGLPRSLFLMHRVELKVSSSLERKISRTVPNAPCGVERLQEVLSECRHIRFVPNAPCGVERKRAIHHQSLNPLKFLMHRVELKVEMQNITRSSKLWFLMHRVELKELNVSIDCAFAEA